MACCCGDGCQSSLARFSQVLVTLDANDYLIDCYWGDFSSACPQNFTGGPNQLRRRIVALPNLSGTYALSLQNPTFVDSFRTWRYNFEGACGVAGFLQVREFCSSPYVASLQFGIPSCGAETDSCDLANIPPKPGPVVTTGVEVRSGTSPLVQSLPLTWVLGPYNLQFTCASQGRFAVTLEQTPYTPWTASVSIS